MGIRLGISACFLHHMFMAQLGGILTLLMYKCTNVFLFELWLCPVRTVS